MTRSFFIGGNWKMHGDLKSIDELISTLLQHPIPAHTDVVVSPPSVYLQYVVGKLEGGHIGVSAQNCYKESKGPFTGEISAEMVQDVGAKWVLIGHSERRRVFLETDELVSEKVPHALCVGLRVILCVGEEKEERKAGQTQEVVFRQLSACIGKIQKWENVVIAYEPVWAIGTGETATPDQAQEVHKFIRELIAEKVSPEVAASQLIIYGGSVNAENCVELAAQKDIDGFLVGGASLKPDFLKIINSRQTP